MGPSLYPCRELECFNQGEGIWLWTACITGNRVQLQRSQWRAGQCMRFRFGQEGTLGKTQRKHAVIQESAGTGLCQYVSRVTCQGTLGLVTGGSSAYETHRQSPNCALFSYSPSFIRVAFCTLTRVSCFLIVCDTSWSSENNREWKDRRSASVWRSGKVWALEKSGPGV